MGVFISIQFLQNSDGPPLGTSLKYEWVKYKFYLALENFRVIDEHLNMLIN